MYKTTALPTELRVLVYITTLSKFLRDATIQSEVAVPFNQKNKRGKTVGKSREDFFLRHHGRGDGQSTHRPEEKIYIRYFKSGLGFWATPAVANKAVGRGEATFSAPETESTKNK